MLSGAQYCKLRNGYLLYYSVSSMGKMTSAIGLATNPTLDPQDPAYHWTDQGLVVRTQDGAGYNESIEASYLCRHDDFYYLFVNWGSCCAGPKSTYNIRIGRSQTVTGPY